MIDPWSPQPLASCHTLKIIGIYLSFVFICGIIFNSIILYILTRIKTRRTPIDIFIIALCTADLLAAILEIPLPLTSNLACRWIYGKYLCYYEAFIAYFVGMIGLYLLTALSLNRYWIIVKSFKEHYVTFRSAYISILLSIAGGLFWAVPPVFGWSDYRLEGVLTTCSINWQDRSMNVISYNILMFIFAYIVPLCIMIYCNMCIYFKVREATNRRLSQSQTMSQGKLQQKRMIMEQRMAKTVFFIIITFAMAWTPYAIVAFISSFISPSIVSPLSGTIPAIFAKSSIYFNPLVYMMANSYVHSKIFGCKCSKTPYELTLPKTTRTVSYYQTKKPSSLIVK